MAFDVVKNAMRRDGLDPNILDNDQSKAYKELPLKDDPKYAKYFKMLKIGLPRDRVRHAMIKDGLDPNILDGDSNAPAKEKLVTKETKVEPKVKARRTRL